MGSVAPTRQVCRAAPHTVPILSCPSFFLGLQPSSRLLRWYRERPIPTKLSYASSSCRKRIGYVYILRFGGRVDSAGSGRPMCSHSSSGSVLNQKMLSVGVEGPRDASSPRLRPPPTKASIFPAIAGNQTAPKLFEERNHLVDIGIARQRPPQKSCFFLPPATRTEYLILNHPTRQPVV